MGVKMGYRKTIKPKNKDPKYTYRNVTKYTPYTDENGNQKWKKTTYRKVIEN